MNSSKKTVAMRAPFPPEGSAIEQLHAQVAGHSMRYLRCGSGPPLVLLHGLLGYSYCWRHNLEELGRSATVYAPDLLGAGFSPRPPGMDGCLRASGERVLQFLDAVGIESADLVGNSHGGALAWETAAAGRRQGRERVRSLVLIAPVNPYSERTPRQAVRFFSSPLGRLAARAGMPLRLAHHIGVRRLYGSPELVRPETVDGYRAALRLPGTLDYITGILRCWEQDLAQLEVAVRQTADLPTLLIWGGRDGAVSPQSAVPLLRVLQNAELAVFRSAGHLVAEECPEEFNRKVAAFLARMSAMAEVTLKKSTE